ncbi:MAG: hypothetical protein ACTHLZ_00135 [Tepidisphaeraceae bacterium]
MSATSVTNDVTKVDLYTFSVTWKTLNLGFIKEVDPTNILPIRKEKKIGNLGDMVVDRVWRGLQGTIKTTHHQCDKSMIQAVAPWWTTGTIPGIPSALNFSEYENSGLLTLHPFELPPDNTDYDLNFPKAFPVFKLPKTGGDWREIDVEWSVYADLTQLSSQLLITHYIGALPE